MDSDKVDEFELTTELNSAQIIQFEKEREESEDRLLLLLQIFQNQGNPVHWKTIHMFLEGKAVKVVILEFLLSESGCAQISSSIPQEFASASLAYNFVGTFGSLYESEGWKVLFSFGGGKPPKMDLPSWMILHIHSLPYLLNDLSDASSKVVELAVQPQSEEEEGINLNSEASGSDALVYQNQESMNWVKLLDTQKKYIWQDRFEKGPEEAPAHTPLPTEMNIRKVFNLPTNETDLMSILKRESGTRAGHGTVEKVLLEASGLFPTHAVASKEEDAARFAGGSSHWDNVMAASMNVSGRMEEAKQAAFGGSFGAVSDVLETADDSEEDKYSEDEGEEDGDMEEDARARKKRDSKRLEVISLDELSTYFHLPISDACKQLGVGLTVLKKKCRSFGIPRWPYRKMKSIDTLIGNIQDLAGGPDGSKMNTVMNAVVELKNEKRSIGESPSSDLGERTKRLRQACFKASYKKRKTNTAGGEEASTATRKLDSKEAAEGGDSKDSKLPVPHGGEEGGEEGKE